MVCVSDNGIKNYYNSIRYFENNDKYAPGSTIYELKSCLINNIWYFE